MRFNSHIHHKIQLPPLPWPEELPFKNSILLSGHLYEVPINAPIAYRKAVEKIGYFFKREFSFDFPPYTHLRNDKNSVVFLWLEPTTIEIIKRSYEVDIADKAMVYGACGFYKEFKFTPGRAALGWVWLHPYKRRKGELWKVWPYFKERFGDFFVDQPNEAMEAFLKEQKSELSEAADS